MPRSKSTKPPLKQLSRSLTAPPRRRLRRGSTPLPAPVLNHTLSPAVILDDDLFKSYLNLSSDPIDVPDLDPGPDPASQPSTSTSLSFVSNVLFDGSGGDLDQLIDPTLDDLSRLIDIPEPITSARTDATNSPCPTEHRAEPATPSPLTVPPNEHDPASSPTTDVDDHSKSPADPDGMMDQQLVNDHNHVGPGHDPKARPYICRFGDCDKAFARKSDLARHFRIHTNDRPYVCLYRECGKSFIQRSALTVHTRTHTGERPHHCEVCLKAFADSSSLARHRRIHTGKRPYACLVGGCGRAFARRNTFLKHYRKHHPGVAPPSSSAATRTTSRKTQAGAPYPLQRATDGTFLAPGPPGPDGQPAYYFSTASTAGSHSQSDTKDSNGSPHAYAAPRYPPEGAVYPYGGHGRNGNGSTVGGGLVGSARSGAKKGARGRTRAGRGGRGPVRGSLQRTVSAPIATPAALGPGGATNFKGQRSGLSTLQTPVSAGGKSTFSISGRERIGDEDDDDYESDLVSPTSTDRGELPGADGIKHESTGLIISSPAGGGFGSDSGTGSGIGFSFGSSDGSHLNVGHAQHGAHLSPLHQQFQGGGGFAFSNNNHHPAWAARSASQGLTYIKTDNVNGIARNVSEPMVKGQPYVPGQGAAGGFHPSQLAIPPQSAHLHPHFNPNGQFGAMQDPNMMSAHSAPVSAIDLETGSREESPEPLIDVHSVPAISFQPPNGPSMPFPLQGPYSALPNGNLNGNPLTQAPPQFALTNPNHQIGRLHSAPPHLQRFNSAPDLTALTDANWNAPTPVNGQYNQNTSCETGEAEEDWEELEEQMLSRDASDVVSNHSESEPSETTKNGQQDEDKEMQLDGSSTGIESQNPQSQSLWGQPVEYPIPAMSSKPTVAPFSSSASTTSNASTLIGSGSMASGVSPQAIPQPTIADQDQPPYSATPVTATMDVGNQYAPYNPSQSHQHQYVQHRPPQIYVPSMTPIYPSPMTPWTSQSQSFPAFDQTPYHKPLPLPLPNAVHGQPGNPMQTPTHYVPSQMKPRFHPHANAYLGSPALIHPPPSGHGQVHTPTHGYGYGEAPGTPVHDITLSTPSRPTTFHGNGNVDMGMGMNSGSMGMGMGAGYPMASGGGMNMGMGLRKESSGVTSVGLGIANVHFDDRTGAITPSSGQDHNHGGQYLDGPPNQQQPNGPPSASFPPPPQNGSDDPADSGMKPENMDTEMGREEPDEGEQGLYEDVAVDRDDDDFDEEASVADAGEEEDDSDDEFVLGRKKKPAKKGKKGGKKGAGARTKRKSK